MGSLPFLLLSSPGLASLDQAKIVLLLIFDIRSLDRMKAYYSVSRLLNGLCLYSLVMALDHVKATNLVVNQGVFKNVAFFSISVLTLCTNVLCRPCIVWHLMYSILGGCGFQLKIAAITSSRSFRITYPLITTKLLLLKDAKLLL